MGLGYDDSLGAGGCVRVVGKNNLNLHLDSVVFSGCVNNAKMPPTTKAKISPIGSGGALYVQSVTSLMITKCNFTTNFAVRDGGALDTQNCDSITIIESSFTNNTAINNNFFM